MKRLLPLILAALLPMPVGAADFPADRIVAAAGGDWNKDANPDLALIAKPEEGSDDDNGIYIYINKGDEKRLELVTALPNKVWGNYAMFGQEPELAALANGSIAITTKNDAVGRDRWRQTLTVAYRNFDFVVAGYTYSSYDTLDQNNTTECDFNVLTGKGKVNSKALTVKGELVLLKDWDDQIGQKACGLGGE
ncbi:hypothetical protein [Sinorhizobium sp. BG8]|uniref:hypothetical protein n=1 Tax=Sinorhizobium sp. BG8 TaxID=2613773 RepID=UPI00193D7F4D|nr:hypothetical protein [Sinorhizobium sp. BG8]QRM55027.1 hypothetical protein F3Y30_11105 [Sinorhizobium sp. BG8]